MNTVSAAAWTSGLSYGLFTSGDAPQAKADFARFPFTAVRKSIEQYRSVQEYFYGDYYPLSEYTQASDGWMAYQFDLPDKGEGFVVVLKRQFSNYRQASFPLTALREDAVYEITNLDSGENKTLTGSELIDKGLEASLLNQPDSALLRYRRKS